MMFSQFLVMRNKGNHSFGQYTKRKTIILKIRVELNAKDFIFSEQEEQEELGPASVTDSAPKRHFPR